MVILCLDQATKKTGVSVWSNGELVMYSIIKSDPKETDMVERMRQMRDGVCKLIVKFKPDLACIEGAQFQTNQRVYGELSRLQGVFFSIFFENNIPFHVVQPTQWKAFCKIKGKKRAEQKKNTQDMVRSDFGFDVSEDIADAIGIGIYAINNFDLKGVKNDEKGTEQSDDGANKENCRS